MKQVIKLVHTGSTLTLDRYGSTESGLLVTIWLPKETPPKPVVKLTLEKE